jgi:hypothetical protein
VNTTGDVIKLAQASVIGSIHYYKTHIGLQYQGTSQKQTSQSIKRSVKYCWFPITWYILHVLINFVKTPCQCFSMFYDIKYITRLQSFHEKTAINAYWATISRYQSKANQPNYLEHMTVQNVLFDLKTCWSREQLRQCLIKDGVFSLKRAAKNTFSSSIVGTLYHLKVSLFKLNLKTANNKKKF